MLPESDIDPLLEAITARLNDSLERYDTERVQEVVTRSAPPGQRLTVDAGGGVHDDSGVRVAAIRRTSGGEWIAERQNVRAPGAAASIPAASL